MTLARIAVFEREIHGEFARGFLFGVGASSMLLCKGGPILQAGYEWQLLVSMEDAEEAVDIRKEFGLKGTMQPKEF
jgi:hypothetical protein